MEPGLRSPRFWRSLSLTAMISPLNESRLDYAFGNQSHRFSPAFLAFDLVTQLFSPYEFNPFNLNPPKGPARGEGIGPVTATALVAAVGDRSSFTCSSTLNMAGPDQRGIFGTDTDQ
jgi:hypothetical protein